MSKHTIKIESAGTIRDTKVLIDGEDPGLPITDIQLSFCRETGVQAVITIAVPEVEIELGSDQVHWVLQRLQTPKEPPRFLGGEKT